MTALKAEGSRRGAGLIYRVGLAAPDSLDLENPLAEVKTPASLNLGLQPAKGNTLIIQPLFLAGGDDVDLALINWGRDAKGNLVALSVRTLAISAALTYRETAGGLFFGEEIIAPANSTLFELRVTAISGTVSKLRIWTY